jgi:hypothetical protein
MVHQPFTVCNSCFYSLIYLILYSRQAVQPNRLQHKHSGALSMDRSMSFISGYDIDIQVHWTYTTKAGSTFSYKIKTIRCDTILQCYTVYCLSSTWVCRHPVYWYKYQNILPSIFIHQLCSTLWFKTFPYISPPPSFFRYTPLQHHWYYKTGYFLHLYFSSSL